MAGKILVADNFEADKKVNSITLSINPKFYSMDAVYSTIYLMIDENYFKIDGDPAEEIIVKIEPKKKADLEMVARRFNNDLINYACAEIRGQKTKDIRSAIISRALQSHMGEDEKDGGNKKAEN